MFQSFVRRLAPQPIVSMVRRLQSAYRARARRRMPALSEARLRDLLAGKLQVARGDIVFVHSSLDGMQLDFPWFKVLAILREAVGPRGTLVFPTYPRGLSYEFLSQGNVFDVHSTPSFTGALSELARRVPGAVRSLHPTKSVCAIGPAAEELCATHHQSPYPYDATSPYFKLLRMGGKAIGLGVSTARMSFVHAVDDYFKGSFPVRVYHPRVFQASCIDASGRNLLVETYAHDMNQMRHDVPRFCKRHLPRFVCEDLKIAGARFFRADVGATLQAMVELVPRGITIYPRSVYARKGTSTCVSD